MPPFGPEKFVSSFAEEEKQLAERRRQLEVDLYNRMHALVQPKRGNGHYFHGREKSVTANYREGSESTNCKTMAWLQIDDLDYTTEWPNISIFTAEYRYSPVKTVYEHTRQLTLRPFSFYVGLDGGQILDESGRRSEMGNREAVEHLEMGMDTVALIEQAQAAKAQAAA